MPSEYQVFLPFPLIFVSFFNSAALQDLFCVVEIVANYCLFDIFSILLLMLVSSKRERSIFNRIFDLNFFCLWEKMFDRFDSLGSSTYRLWPVFVCRCRCHWKKVEFWIHACVFNIEKNSNLWPSIHYYRSYVVSCEEIEREEEEWKNKMTKEISSPFLVSSSAVSFSLPSSAAQQHYSFSVTTLNSFSLRVLYDAKKGHRESLFFFCSM